MTYINYILHTIYFNYYFRTSTLGLGKKRSAELLRGSAAPIRASLAHKRPGWRLDAAHIGRIATRAASPSPGSGGDGAVFNPHIEAFSSHGNGTLSVLKENSPTEFVLKEIVKIKARAKTCTLDDKTDHVLVVTCEGGRQGGGPQMLDCDHRHVGPEDVARVALAVSVTRSDPPMTQRSQDFVDKVFRRSWVSGRQIDGIDHLFIGTHRSTSCGAR
jgi:hypothetical protein